MQFRNSLLSAMTKRDVADLFPAMREVSLSAGQVLCEQGRLTELVYFPASAVISVVTAMEDGREVETASIGNEGVAGLLSALTDVPPRTRMYVQIPGAAISLPASRLRAQAIESVPFAQLVLRSAQANAAQTEQSAACNALHHLPARLARWLLICQDRVDSPVMTLTQDYMGVMAGALRSSISLTASEFKEAGLIRYSRGQLEILDRRGLEKRACECYRADRANRESLLFGDYHGVANN
jgi:CRP-like cAMP-binding protein